MRPFMNKFRFLVLMIALIMAGTGVQVYQIWQNTVISREAHDNGEKLQVLTTRFCLELNRARQVGNQQLRIPQKKSDLALAKFLRDIAAHTPDAGARQHELALAAQLESYAAQIEIVGPYTCKF